MFFLAGKDPVPIRCPVAGAFNFTQEGDFKFITRYIGGITKDPRHDVWGRTGQFSCKQNISRMAICGKFHSPSFLGSFCQRNLIHYSCVSKCNM